MLEKIDKVGKKLRYVIQSGLVLILVSLYASRLVVFSPVAYFLIAFVIVAAGLLLLHLRNLTVKNFISAAILPITLLISAFFFYKYYQSLGTLLKVISVIYFGVMYYLISLVDNILLVVHSRDESIPLYRVAVSWSQILEILVALPLISSIYRMDLPNLWHLFYLLLITLVLVLYQLWVLNFDPDSKNPGVGEAIFLICLSLFFVMSSHLAVAFMAGEEFLRGLFMCSVILFALNYMISYLKNEINKKFIIQYFSIMIVFFILFVLLAP